MSRCLADRGVDHLVLERREVADTWATQRWDGFRLNTPAWMNPLLGPLPDGAFPGRDEVVARLRASAAGLPVQPHSPVLSVRRRAATASWSARPTASTSPTRSWSRAAG